MRPATLSAVKPRVVTSALVSGLLLAVVPIATPPATAARRSVEAPVCAYPDLTPVPVPTPSPLPTHAPAFAEPLQRRPRVSAAWVLTAAAVLALFAVVITNAIRGREPVTHTDLATGVKYMEWTDAVTRSLRSGNTVRLPLAEG